MLEASEETRQVVTQFWAAMQANDWRAAAALFDPAYTLEWPQSGERIVGAANFMALNAHYPAAGRWQFTIDRLVVAGDSAVTDVGVTDGAATARAITFTRVRAGRIVAQDFGELSRAVEYWPEPFAAPAWRAAWVERSDQPEPPGG
jgi:limonene-1,2-epoxide hydrolase